MPAPHRKPASTYPTLVGALLPGVVQNLGADPTDITASLRRLEPLPAFEGALQAALTRLSGIVRAQSAGFFKEEQAINAALTVLGATEMTRSHVALLRTVLPTAAVDGGKRGGVSQRELLRSALEEAFISALEADELPEAGESRNSRWDKARPGWRSVTTLGGMMLEVSNTPTEAVDAAQFICVHLLQRYGAGIQSGTFDWIPFRTQQEGMRQAVLGSEPVQKAAKDHVAALIANPSISFRAVSEACDLFGLVRETAEPSLIERAKVVVRKIGKSHAPTTAASPKVAKTALADLARQCDELASSIPFQPRSKDGIQLSVPNRAAITNLFAKAIRTANAEPNSPHSATIVRALGVVAEPSLAVVAIDDVVPRKEFKALFQHAFELFTLEEETFRPLLRLARFSKSTDVHKYGERVLEGKLNKLINTALAHEETNAELLGKLEAALSWAILYGCVNPEMLAGSLERRNRMVNSLEQLDAAALLTATIAVATTSAKAFRGVQARVSGILNPESFDVGPLQRRIDNPLTALKSSLRPVPGMFPNGGSETMQAVKTQLGLCADPLHTPNSLDATVSLFRSTVLPGIFPHLTQLQLYAIAGSLAAGSRTFRPEPLRARVDTYRIDRVCEKARLHQAHGAFESADLILEDAFVDMDLDECGPEDERIYLRLLSLRINNDFNSPTKVAALGRAHFEAIAESNAGLRTVNYMYARNVLGQILDRVHLALGEPDVSVELKDNVVYLTGTYLKLLQAAPSAPLNSSSFFHSQRIATRLVHLLFELRAGTPGVQSDVLEGLHRELDHFVHLLDTDMVSWPMVNAFENAVEHFEKLSHYAIDEPHFRAIRDLRKRFEPIAGRLEKFALAHQESDAEQGRLLQTVLSCKQILSEPILNR